MCTETEEDSCMQGDQASGLHCLFHHYFILMEIVWFWLLHWESSAKESNCFYSCRRNSLSLPVHYWQHDQYSFVQFLPSPHHLTALEYCPALLFMFVLSFMSLDPLVLAVQITIQLPLMESISTRLHVLEIHWRHGSPSSSYCFQAVKDLIQCMKVFPLTH